MRHFIYLILFCLLACSSCCTRADCNLVMLPRLQITFRDFTDNELSDKCLYTYDTAGNILIDSIPVYALQPLPPVYVSRENDKYYVIRIGERYDTLHRIGFVLYDRMIQCNKCFPPGYKDGRAIQTSYTDLRFDLNGTTVTNSEEVVIIK